MTDGADDVRRHRKVIADSATEKPRSSSSTSARKATAYRSHIAFRGADLLRRLHLDRNHFDDHGHHGCPSEL